MNTDNSLKIAVLRHAYQPDMQGMERPGILGEEYTLDEAVAKIEEINSNVYVLEHGESGRPTYVVVEWVDANWVEGGRNQDMSNYDWDGAGCDCGECAECTAMMIAQDRDYILAHALYKG